MRKIGRFLMGASTALAMVTFALAATPATARAQGCPTEYNDHNCVFHNGGQSITCCFWLGQEFQGCCTLNAQ